MKLDGKIVVVTGASSGIGEATAEALTAEGATVVAVARREERLEDLRRRLEGNGARIMTTRCDITDEKQAHSLIHTAREEFGRVDILVNNAGVMLPSRIEKGLSDDWRKMFEVNVLGLLYATDAAVAVMKEQGSGHIVNVSSVAGRVSSPPFGVYSGSKYAVNAISESLRSEVVEYGIRVTIIEPGAVVTELTDHITDDEVRKALSGEEFEKLRSEDIANAISYAVTQPQRVNVNELLIMPTEQA